MGRRTPPYTNEQIHPAISVSILIAFVAATIVVIAALCGSKSKIRGRKGSKASKPSSVENDSDIETPPTSTKPQERPPPPESYPSPQSSPSPPPADEERNTGEDPEQSLPMFNLMSKENESLPKKLTVKTRRRLSTSLSMRAGGTALAKMLTRKEEPPMKKMPFFMMTRAIDYQHILSGRHGHYQFLGPTHLLIEIKKQMYLVGYLCAKNENPQYALMGCIYSSDS